MMYLQRMQKGLLFSLLILLIGGCQPEIPSTSVIRVNGESEGTPVNPLLYGLTLEEINHAIDGGIYAELIRNRSFEESVPPLNCPYDYTRQVITTPNGWSIPFPRFDSVPGWRALSKNTWLYLDKERLINEQNHRALAVFATITTASEKGGVIAEGYEGIPIREGEKYNLSFYSKGSSYIPKTIRVSLVDDLNEQSLSDVYEIAPTYEWRKYHHIFTAKTTTRNAHLLFTTDSTTVFWLDVVSLFPEHTWKDRQNGLRPELMEPIEALNPRFIRFPGGSVVEGYTAGTFPIWRETIGSIDERKHFWTVWAYGTTNGVGFHEYLQLCEDLQAEPIYVVNSGVTSQSRRPRYEDITQMDRMVQDALDALAYANQPADSTWGALRAKHGHREPFNLKYIEVGSENYGNEYSKRFNLFKHEIEQQYPGVTVISSSMVRGKIRNDWVDTHLYTTESFLLSSENRYAGGRLQKRMPQQFIGEFGLIAEPVAGSMRAAICEAAFMIGVENGQNLVRRLAYAPIVGNTNYPLQRQPAILFDGQQVVLSPTYHVLNLFGNHRGDLSLSTKVDTYRKLPITYGRVGIEVFDNSYDFEAVQINGQPVEQGDVKSGDWTIDSGQLKASPNRWNNLSIGDSTAYNYTFSARIQRTKGSDPIQFRVRDNALSDEQADYMGFSIGFGKVSLYHQAGAVRDSLQQSVAYPFHNHRWYDVKIQCKDDHLACYVNDTLVQEATLAPIPSLFATAAIDTVARHLILKVVNTTQHEERTAFDLDGLHVSSKMKVIQLKGDADARNTYTKPHLIEPQTHEVSFLIGMPRVYAFPPNSISILLWPLEE